jgi:hypothetical protein
VRHRARRSHTWSDPEVRLTEDLGGANLTKAALIRAHVGIPYKCLVPGAAIRLQEAVS